MPNENAGRADKSGNRYEIKCVVYHLLKVLDEKIDYVVLEALGDDERGVDIWIGEKDGRREGQQCKGRNGSKENWDFGSVKANGIFAYWKYHLDRDERNSVALVSPLAFTFLEDLVLRAKNTNENPKDFYLHQISTASEAFSKFFRNFCDEMEINPEKDLDLVRCISYLKRMAYKQFPDTEMKDLILSEIGYLLAGDSQEIYQSFITWIIDGDILGKEINQCVIYSFLKEKNIMCRNLSADERIMPRMEELNEEYRNAFTPLNDELVYREEFSKCRELVNLGNSLIIHGKAGRGKSGCTIDIIKHCEERSMPYIAIKLDQHVPSGTAEKWGRDLGLPTSLAHCIHSISKNQRAVIILDQLDALRWTLAHSRDALLVCTQIINQVAQFNSERENKISIVFVCRTYDLDNDNNISLLFKSGEKEKVIEWYKVHVNEMEEEVIKRIVGERYAHLTSKLQEILRIPSNLYIWQHLDPREIYVECSSANHLISEWWKQLSEKCFNYGLNEAELYRTKEEVISSFESLNKLYVPLNILKINMSCLEFLSSNAFLTIQGNKLQFAHQSILDYFLSNNMFERYYKGEDVVEIVGIIEKQTPGRRYQAQMFMQSLLEFDSQDFIYAGMKLFEAKHIRYYFKYIFFEVLNQVDNLDINISNFIVENCESKAYGTLIINSVAYANKNYFALLRKKGILDRWFCDPKKKDIVFNLLIGISPNYEKDDIDFIESHSFKSNEDDLKFVRCFSHDISQDSDDLFELRMKFYNKYPKLVNTYFNFTSMIQSCEIRTIRLFEFLLQNKIRNREEDIYKYEEELFHEDSAILLSNGMDAVNMLAPYIPLEKNASILYSDWSGRYFNKRNLERTCLKIIKNANAAIINLNPELFFERYKDFMGKGYYLFNEIILDGLCRLPVTYCDMVMKYLYDDIESNMFDKTSDNSDELFLTKMILGTHSRYCSEEIFVEFENRVLNYVSTQAKEKYKRRIEYNKKNNGNKVYWSFWGDFQREVLEVLPNDRLSKHSKDLLVVLNRRLPNGTSIFRKINGHGGWVKSPIDGKKLSDKKWLELITKENFRRNSHSSWNEVPGGFIDNSIEEFSRSFSYAATEEPERMIKLIVSNEGVSEIFVDSLFSGVAFSKNLESVPVQLIETMIVNYPYNYTSQRALYICSIIMNRKSNKWSQKILDILKDIAINHEDPQLDKPNITNNEDKDMHSFDMLMNNSINCVRGNSAQVISQLLWNDSSLFCQFKYTIEKLTLDNNPAIRLASLFILWPSYNIEKEWSSKKILSLLEQDYRLSGYPDSINMFFLLYPQHRKSVIKIIRKCYESVDNALIKVGAYCISGMFILKHEFVDVINSFDTMSKTQAEAILYALTKYFNKDEYNSISKEIILKFKTSPLDLEFAISRLFYDDLINLERDRDFLIELMNSKLSYRIAHAFVHYLEEKSVTVATYKDVIFSLAYYLLNNEDGTDNRVWGIEDEISKLVIGLYDETSNSSFIETRKIAEECLDIWDLMFEKQIGSIRSLSQKIMDR